jgi:hypothetical protein
MRQRGRKSSASLAVATVCEVPRPAPPRSMSREAKAIWRATTARFRPDFFCGGEHLLEAYAEGVQLLRDLLKRIAETKAAEPVDYKRLAILVSLQRQQGLLLARLGSTLRLSPKSRFDRYSVRPTPNLPKPWDLCSRRDDDGPERGGSPFDGAG